MPDSEGVVHVCNICLSKCLADICVHQVTPSCSETHQKKMGPSSCQTYLKHTFELLARQHVWDQLPDNISCNYTLLLLLCAEKPQPWLTTACTRWRTEENIYAWQRTGMCPTTKIPNMVISRMNICHAQDFGGVLTGRENSSLPSMFFVLFYIGAGK